MTAVHGFPLIDGGWRIRTTNHFHVDILRMMHGNLRIVLTPKERPREYDRGWCYSGRQFADVVIFAVTFEPDAGQEPEGWVREVATDRRTCGAYFPPGKQNHRGYVPDCPDCG